MCVDPHGAIRRVGTDDRKIGLSLKRAQWRAVPGDGGERESAPGEARASSPPAAAWTTMAPLGTDKIRFER